ncbi:putative multidrug export ATP-binding/permease protein [bacterium BMS3Bbin06]|nr:putative multidrug export ATP-binding/permease protein [bacterium BMS3Abin08]GBE33650.1 putative multidrug export ATP-binding/permease protein [bacterium BMS3Bbin06]HDO36530.1 ABC transporter ATP-binding protein [Nitrospirota bacterium]HDY70430.1 ABC transporter ATP-binding protein [Nitrospirota bacterium]
MSKIKKMDNRSGIRELISLIKPYRKRVVLSVILSIVLSGINGSLAWLVKPAMNGIFLERREGMLLLISVAVFALYISRGMLSFGQSYLMTSVGMKIVRDLRDRLYRHMILIPLRQYNEKSTSMMLSRIINDAGQLQKVIAHSIKDLFVEGATVVALAAVAFYRRWDLTLISIAVLPFAFYGVGRFGKRLKHVTKASQRKISNITELITETFTGIKMVKVFGREEALVDLFRRKNHDFYRENMRATRIVEATSLLMEFVGGLGITFVLWYGGRLVIKGEISPGDFFSFIAAILMLYTPAKRLAKVNNGIQQARASLERVNEFFVLETERPGKGELKTIEDCMEFREVSFRYPGSKDFALKGIDLTIGRGKVIALVGRSGAGKTTFIDLVPRFHDPTEGGIFIDGVDIRNVSLHSLRAQIGVVSQDVILFNDTVRANIAFGRPAATGEDIVEAARAAYAHGFIEKLPDGYDTVIGEKGVRLSGGQRQRLSIARAILKNPPILILDEATSSLDTHAEMMVQKALDDLMCNRTTIVIAHRLSTVRMADLIVVLEKGRIVEKGTHEELLGRDGIYRRLHEIQFSVEVPVR